eukprot:TRINITY_DN24383_c0_g2_i1.p1 TRINITY_DN24383_c0_g2~~TRINITY_DN24383_c0_g2_i1.p1  ORF type:complete len:434 (+),score=93.30 TRINITY_DN24383_c0_g2_i1:93-1304(+)
MELLCSGAAYCSVLEEASSMKLWNFGMPEMPHLPNLPVSSWKIKLPKLVRSQTVMDRSTYDSSAFFKALGQMRSMGCSTEKVGLHKIAANSFLAEGMSGEQRREIRSMLKDLSKQARDSDVSEEDLLTMFELVSEQVTALYQPQMEAFIAIVGAEDATLQHYWDDFINQGDDPVGRPNPFTVPSPTAVQRLWNVLFRIAWLRAGGQTVTSACQDEDRVETAAHPTADDDTKTKLASLFKDMAKASKHMLRASKAMQQNGWSLDATLMPTIENENAAEPGSGEKAQEAADGCHTAHRNAVSDAVAEDMRASSSASGLEQAHDFPRLLDSVMHAACELHAASTPSCGAAMPLKAIASRGCRCRHASLSCELAFCEMSSDLTTAPPSEVDACEVGDDAPCFLVDSV